MEANLDLQMKEEDNMELIIEAHLPKTEPIEIELVKYELTLTHSDINQKNEGSATKLNENQMEIENTISNDNINQMSNNNNNQKSFEEEVTCKPNETLNSCILIENIHQVHHIKANVNVSTVHTKLKSFNNQNPFYVMEASEAVNEKSEKENTYPNRTFSIFVAGGRRYRFSRFVEYATKRIIKRPTISMLIRLKQKVLLMKHERKMIADNLNINEPTFILMRPKDNNRLQQKILLMKHETKMIADNLNLDEPNFNMNEPKDNNKNEDNNNSIRTGGKILVANSPCKFTLEETKQNIYNKNTLDSPNHIRPAVTEHNLAPTNNMRPAVTEHTLVPPNSIRPAVTEHTLAPPNNIRPEVTERSLAPEVTENTLAPPNNIRPEVTEHTLAPPNHIRPDVTEGRVPLIFPGKTKFSDIVSGNGEMKENIFLSDNEDANDIDFTYHDNTQTEILNSESMVKNDFEKDVEEYGEMKRTSATKTFKKQKSYVASTQIDLVGKTSHKPSENQDKPSETNDKVSQNMQRNDEKPFTNLQTSEQANEQIEKSSFIASKQNLTSNELNKKDNGSQKDGEGDDFKSFLTSEKSNLASFLRLSVEFQRLIEESFEAQKKMVEKQTYGKRYSMVEDLKLFLIICQHNENYQKGISSNQIEKKLWG